MRVSSFKAQYRQAPLRTATPPPPPYEPLSPILRPSGASPVHPAGGKDDIATRDSNAARAAIHRTPDYTEPDRPRLQLSSPAVTFGPPPPSAPLPLAHPQYSSALGSPIDALADAAASSLRTTPAHSSSARRRPHVPSSANTALNHPLGEHNPHQAYGDRSIPLYEERPSKRARSEFFPSTQAVQQQYSRPATSHVPHCSYNVEQMVDNGTRMYQDNQPSALHPDESSSKRLSDAQLLLDFHRAVSSSHSVQTQHLSVKRHSISHPQSHQAQAARFVEPTSPYVAASYSQVGPLDLRYPPADNDNHSHTRPLPAASSEHTRVVLTVQTHTPPEETLGTILSRVEVEGEDGEEKKPKKHQGWPKGKPRGPRTTPAMSKRKKSTPKPKSAPSISTSTVPGQLHSPQSLPAEGSDISRPLATNTSSTYDLIPREAASQPRRRSFSHTTSLAPHSGGVHPSVSRARSVPVQSNPTATLSTVESSAAAEHREDPLSQTTICAGCHSSDSLTLIGDGEQWISCDGCKGWFHFVCAGFRSEREVREIDKFYCDGCQPKFGNTTKVRKSGRAHTAVDYAGLNEGILKTSDDNPEHHYIQAFKNGDLKFSAETFARLPPEHVNADFLEKMSAFTEPVVIPASLNPRPKYPNVDYVSDKEQPVEDEEQYGYDMVPDDGQDKIDMVIPAGLTVRRVSELYGPQERVPVIDVKAQEGEDKRWTMAKWTDYYEQRGEKPVRNVISLEVSRSRLGKLIRRPKVVRDMDLQDSVWPEDDKANAPPVQFYCLMSVADCYTDFHIDFGGSSVYYHIVKGRKTFFFIPPTKQNLKKYEDWCLSPRQSHEFLGQQVKDCYRVDLYPGDTMLIPSGWIHAVWTPEDSLVIGGNYLTKIHYGMQIKVVEIEKNTKVAPKFRYPFFQKIMWLSLLRYLDDDPLPLSVVDLLLGGGQFHRAVPIYCETDKFGHNSHLGSDNYNRRYYAKAELEGLPDLVNYIWRTVMISLGRIDGITQVVRNAVTRSIPKGHGEPIVLARRFALWVAWKRGNESIPQWAHSDASLPDALDAKEKKLSAAQIKRIERESLREVLKATTPRNVRTRGSEPSVSGSVEIQAQSTSLMPTVPALPMTGFLRPSREHVTTPKTSQLGPKRIACDACRKRRIRCKHKDDLVESPRANATSTDSTNGVPSGAGSPSTTSLATLAKRHESDVEGTSAPPAIPPSMSEVRTIITGTPISTEINPEAWANKSNRIKACADCRKSKRRCIHDENGNIDPIKASETPVPRGSASKKRRISGDNDEGEALNKKIKRDSFAGLINGEVSHYNRYPLAHPVSQPEAQDSMSVHSAHQALDLASSDEVLPIDPQLSGDMDGKIQTATPPSNAHSRETIISSIEDHSEDSMEDVVEANLIDPELLNLEPHTPTPTHNGSASAPHGGVTDELSPLALAVQSISPGYRPANNTADITPNRPWASRVSGTPRRKSQTPHALSRWGSTPKSSRGRRNSTIKLEPKSDSKPRAASSIENHEEDQASLALAMQLQMEEHGLRRRSK